MTEMQKNTYHPDSCSVCRSCAVAYEAWKRNRSSESNQYRERDQEIASSSASESSGTTPSVSSASLSESLPSSAGSSSAGPSRKRRYRSDLHVNMSTG